MEHPGFFDRAGPWSLAAVAARCEAELPAGADGERAIVDIRPIDEAGPDHLTFVDNKKYLPLIGGTRAAACFIQPVFADRLPPGTVALIAKSPYRSFALALAMLYPQAMRPRIAAPCATPVHPSARLEDGVEVQAGAVIGPEAMVGRGTIVAAGAVVGYRCTVGRDCFIGASVTVSHSLIGDRVILHAGVRLGQDGFGFAMSARGHLKVPQIGRVVLQDDVEIGANTTVDRGALKDTIIGEGTKIDNLVQIGHNVVIGRHCVIVGQCGIAGSSVLGDFVVMGGQAGVAGHLKVGNGAQIAGASHAKEDIPAGARVIGTPTRTIREWTREQMALKRLSAGAATNVDTDE